MEIFIKVFGRMMSRMEMESSFWKMDSLMRASLWMVKSMGMAPINGQQEMFFMEILSRTNGKA